MCSVTEIHGFPPAVSTLSSSSPSPGLSATRHAITPGSVGWWSSPARTRRRELPVSTSFTPKHSPASLSTPSPSPRSTGSSDAFSPSFRAGSDFWSSSPSPCNDPWRPYSYEPRHSGSGGSTVSSPGTIEALPHLTSSNSLGLTLSGTPRQRQAFNLPCSPQTPKSFDRYHPPLHCLIPKSFRPSTVKLLLLCAN